MSLSWLNKSFLEKILQNYKKDPTIKVKKFQINPDRGLQEVCTSLILRINVSFSSKLKTKQRISLFIKTIPPEEGFQRTFLLNSPAFSNEAIIYTKILPEMERILENIGEKVKFSPNLVAHQSLNLESLIFLEDLTNQGYQVFDDFGINEIQVLKIILRKLAKFHAASMFLSLPLELDKFDEHFYKNQLTDDKNPVKPLILNGFKEFVEILKTLGPEYEKFHQKLKGNIENLFEKASKCYTRETAFKVLCHGELQSKNLLHRKSCLNKNDLLMIDYQFPIWTSPAIDLYYVLNILGDSNLLDDENKRNELIYEYYQEFSSILKRLKFVGKIPTLVDLHVELLQCSTLEFLQQLQFVNPKFLDYQNLDFDELIFDPDAARKVAHSMYENPEYLSFLKKSLTRHFYLGSMD